MILKQFLLFGGGAYYPAGGWSDFVDSFDSYSEAEEHIKKANADYKEKYPGTIGDMYDWHHIIDIGSHDPN